MIFQHSSKCIRPTDGQTDTLPIQVEQAECRTEYQFRIEQVVETPVITTSNTLIVVEPSVV